jgi:hypothetical protein
MSTIQRKPSWWLLLGLLPLTIGLLWLDSRAALPPWGHETAEVGIVLFVGGLADLWVRVNAGALLWDEVRRAASATQYMIYLQEPPSPIEDEPVVESERSPNVPHRYGYSNVLPRLGASYLVQHPTVRPVGYPTTSDDEGDT